MTVMPDGWRKLLADTIIYHHQSAGAGVWGNPCRCGWGTRTEDLGKSHGDHVVEVFERRIADQQGDDMPDRLVATERFVPNCPVKGCKTHVPDPAYIGKHASLRHRRCSCGWVGVDWGLHVRIQERMGKHEHAEVGNTDG